MAIARAVHVEQDRHGVVTLASAQMLLDELDVEHPQWRDMAIEASQTHRAAAPPRVEPCPRSPARARHRLTYDEPEDWHHPSDGWRPHRTSWIYGAKVRGCFIRHLHP
ncbi:hypothetical protein GCM10022205_58940 [Spinactinospora alkalitolerans]